MGDIDLEKRLTLKEQEVLQLHEPFREMGDWEYCDRAKHFTRSGGPV